MVSKSMSMRKSRKMRRSRGMSMRKSRKMRRSMRMRGGNGYNSGQSTYLQGSDNSSLIASASGDSIQDVDRNSSTYPLADGPAPNLSGYQQPPPFNGTLMNGGRRKRRSMRMRGGNDAMPTEPVNPDNASVAPTVGGRRRRAKGRRGGGLIETAAVPFGLWGLQRMVGKNKHKTHRRHMRGGNVEGATADVPAETPAAVDSSDSNLAGDTNQDGGRRRRAKGRRGGGLVATAAVPFGLWGLQRYFNGSRGSAMTKKQHRRRR